MTDNIARQPKGRPTGGQFAATAKSESDLDSLDDASSRGALGSREHADLPWNQPGTPGLWINGDRLPMARRPVGRSVYLARTSAGGFRSSYLAEPNGEHERRTGAKHVLVHQSWEPGGVGVTITTTADHPELSEDDQLLRFHRVYSDGVTRAYDLT